MKFDDPILNMKNEKEKLKKDLQNLLLEFNKNTGCYVVDIKLLNNTDSFKNFKNCMIVNLDIKA